MKFSFTTLLASVAPLLAVTEAGNAWAVYRSISSDNYGKTLHTMTGQGYRPTYVSAYANVRGEARYNAVFEKPSSTPAWRTNYGYTASEFNKTFEDLRKGGFRPTLVEGYTIGGEPRFASIWDKNNGDIMWYERINMAGDEFMSRFNDLVSKGYRLRHVSGYSCNDQQRFTGVFDKLPSPPWRAYIGLTGAEYQAKFDEAKKDGFYAVQISPYTAGGRVWFAGIFEKMDGKKDKPYTRFGLTAAEYKMEVTALKAKGYRPTVVAGYLDNEERFAVIFNKN